MPMFNLRVQYDKNLAIERRTLADRQSQRKLGVQPGTSGAAIVAMMKTAQRKGSTVSTVVIAESTVVTTVKLTAPMVAPEVVRTATTFDVLNTHAASGSLVNGGAIAVVTDVAHIGRIHDDIDVL